MTPTGSQLLGLLGSGVRPVGPVRGVDPLRMGEPGEARGAAFAALLEKARGGALGSGLGVEIEPATGLQLTEDQMRRLEATADLATAQGARRAVVLLDGKALVLDVEQRRVLEAHDVDTVPALAGIDAVVGAAAPAAAEPALGLSGLTPTPGWLAGVLDAGAAG